MSNSNPQNIEQLRAKSALKFIECYKENTESDRLKSYARSFPTMILINGFGQAMAFIKAKSKNKEKNKEENEESYAYDCLYKAIQDWLLKDKEDKNKEDKDLITAITKMSQQEYQIATTETLAYCKWIKQLAAALIEPPSKKDNERSPSQ